MRISTNSIIDPYQRALERIQAERLKNQLRASTGKQLTELADDPVRYYDGKNLSRHIERRDAYMNVIETSLEELAAAQNYLTSISDKMQRIREIAIDASTTGNSTNLFSLSVYVKGILEDLVRDANADFNGHFLFSGTKTTSESLNKTEKASDPYPFEIIEEKTPDNVSGLKVVFKGNNEDRIINKEAAATETINAKASDLFGGAGDEIFKTIVDLHNILAYRPDGKKRETTDLFSKEDIAKINEYQQKIADAIARINGVNSSLGAKYKNLSFLREQILGENVVLKDFRSRAEDADVAETALKLKKGETALAYALRVGSRLLPQTLFDFI